MEWDVAPGEEYEIIVGGGGGPACAGLDVSDEN